MWNNSSSRTLITAGVILATLASPALGQQISLDLGESASLTSTSLHIIFLVTILSIAPGIIIMITCFPFIVTVLSILRQAIGLQQSPPNMLIVSLALFLTYFVMAPVFQEAYELGIAPFLSEQIEAAEALSRSYGPFHAFMQARVDPDTLHNLSQLSPDGLRPMESPSVLIPAFMISEIERAFQIGFLIFIPFLIIDLVVAAILMAMGMMMVPPAVVSLPFKLIFFVVSDGWELISVALVRGYLG